VPDPRNGNSPVLVRRRRTRRHRRNRLVRRWLTAAVVAVFVAGASSVAMRYLSPSLFRARGSAANAYQQLEHNDQTGKLNQILEHTQTSRPVYPYSVVPGGVEDAKELKWVAEHDPIVAAHYAGFDYARAQVVRLTLARTVYLSYRIGNRIYWTSHRVTLKKGEKLITDGRITARTRCANRVEETQPQQEASPSEPTAEKFEEPVRAGEGTAMQAPPVPFESALLNRQQTPGLGPAGPLSLYDPFVGGNFISISVPPLPEGGLCGPVKKKTGTDAEFEGGAATKKKTPGPCGTAVVPEPGTWLLFASGLAAIVWRFRSRMARA
jgi:hypothetical protein